MIVCYFFRETFRKLFGPPKSKATFMKVLFVCVCAHIIQEGPVNS